MQTFSFSPPIDFTEEGKWLLAVTSYEATNSVFKITNKNKSFSIARSGNWSSTGVAEVFSKLQKLLEMRHKNGIEFNVEVRKKGNQTKIGDIECKLFDLDTRKNEIIEELKTAENNDH